jgi:hypothetical protein
MRYEIIRSGWAAARLHVVWAREESSFRSWIRPDAPDGVSGRSHFEEDIHVLSRLLVPTRAVRLQFDAQFRVAAQKLRE